MDDRGFAICTGIDPALLLEELKANQARLDNCPRHHFPTWPNDGLVLAQKFDCSVCGGRIDALHAYAYTRGYVAAGGNGNDIFPGWSS